MISTASTNTNKMGKPLSQVFLEGEFVQIESNMDTLLEHIVRPLGIWQWSVVLISLLTVPPSATFPVFANTEPMHRCRLESEAESFITKYNLTFHQVSLMIAPTSSVVENALNVGCYRYVGNWTNTEWLFELFNNATTHENVLDKLQLESCPLGYVYQYRETQYPNGVVEEFDTVCQTQWLTPFSTSMYMLGMLLGLTSGGWFSDRYGRKRTALAFSLLELSSGVIVSLAPNYTVYMLGRMSIACAITGKIIALTVLQMELTLAKYRSVLNATTTIGHNFVNRAIVALLAYSIPYWRWLNAAVMLPSLLSILCFALPESPRWLYSQHRFKDTIKTLRHGYWMNHKFMKVPSQIDNVLEHVQANWFSELERKHSMNSEMTKTKSKSIRSIRELRRAFSTSVLCRASFVGGLLFAGNVVCYFGLLFYARVIEVSIYWTAFINASMAVPGTILFAILYRYIRFRRMPLSMLYSATAVILLAGAIYSFFSSVYIHLVLMVCANFALMLLGAAFSMLYVYIPELFPSAVRSQGLGVASGFGRIGGFWCTFINNTNRYISIGFPLLVYGFVSLLTLSALRLMNDTTGENLQDFVPLPASTIVHQTKKEDENVCHEEQVV